MRDALSFECLEKRTLLSAEAFAAVWADLDAIALSTDEMAEVVEAYDLDSAYASTSWGAENYWFAAADGEVLSLWHGGTVHDADGDGAYDWQLTSITDASGVGMKLRAGSISGAFTPWRALNIVGLDADGQVQTYWWSPEAGRRGWGENGNGWSLTNLNQHTDFDDLGGGDVAFRGGTETRIEGRTIRIMADHADDDGMMVVMSFTPGEVSDNGSAWAARAAHRWDADDDDDSDDDNGGSADDEDDLILTGDTTIAIDEVIEGDVTIMDGTLTILGSVAGDVTQIGEGDVIVDGGMVEGDIREDGAGDVSILAGGVVGGDVSEKSHGGVLVTDSTVGGDIDEKGPGDVEVMGSSVEGDIDEKGPGDVVVVDSVVKGDIDEKGPGDVRADAHDTEDVVFVGDTTIAVGEVINGNVMIMEGTLTVLGTVAGDVTQIGVGGVIIDGGLIKGDVRETGLGGVGIMAGGVVEGDIDEFDRGDIAIAGGSLVEGDAVERDFGSVLVVDSAVGGDVEESGEGDVDISGDSVVGGTAVEEGPGELMVAPESVVEDGEGSDDDDDHSDHDHDHDDDDH